jgi:hypothetical protein
VRFDRVLANVCCDATHSAPFRNDATALSAKSD